MLSVKVKVINKPGPVPDLKVKEMIATTFILRWSPPLHDGGRDITGYIVEKREGNRRMWQNVTTTEATEFEVPGLFEGNQYNFRVSAENAVGIGEPVEMKDLVSPKSQFSVPGIPGKPLLSDVCASSCKLTWKEPSTDGGSPITGYTVERRTGAGLRWIPLKLKASTTELEVVDLFEDEKYEFRVIAENKMGQGKPSEATESIIAKNPWKVPGAPGKPEIRNIRDTSLALSWTAPTDDGGCKIDGYVVEYCLEGSGNWVRPSTELIPDREFVVRNLTTGASYEFRVAAKNRAGLGKFSSSTKPIKAAAPLVGEPPEILQPFKDLTVVAPNSAVFECRIDLGEPEAKVRCFKDSKELYNGAKYQIVVEGESVKLVVSNTESTDASRYRCEAANQLGKVETAAQLTVHTEPKVSIDAKFTGVQKIKGGLTMILQANMTGTPTPTATWYHEEKPIEKTVQASVETSASRTTLTVKNATGLNSGRYKVVAENCAGIDSGEFEVQVTDKPSSPVDLKLTERHKDYMIMTWKAPESDGGAPITGYVIEKREGNRTTWTKAGETSSENLRFKATKLIEGSIYYFRVAAENSIGVGPFVTLEDGTKAALPFNVPKAPRNVHVDSLDKSSVVLAWQAPESDGGGELTGYIVEKRQSYSTRWVPINKAPISAPTFTVRDVTEGDEYEFRVLAVNEAGAGNPSESTGIVVPRDPYSKPGQPGAVTVNLENGVATLQWTKPKDDGNKPIKNYVVEMKSGSEIRWKVANVGKRLTDTTYKVEGLRPGTDYEFRVSAENEIGTSKPSTAIPVRYEEAFEFTKHLQDIKVTKLPKTVTFECEVNKTNAPVTWYKDDQPLKGSQRLNIEASGKIHSLTIKGVDSEDEAVYSAVVKNEKTAGKLFIQTPPEFIMDRIQDTLTLKEGDSVAIEIPYTGSPPPKVTWEFEKKPLEASRRLTVDVIRNMTSVCIGHVEMKDAGLYTVTLENQFGKVSLSIRVKVFGRPSAPRDLTVTEVTDSSVSLKWKTPETDGGKKIIRYIIERRDQFKSVYMPVGTTESCDYRVIRLVAGNEYVIQVSAENEVGVGEPAELSQGITAKSPFSVPGAPQAPTAVDILANSMKLHWRAPDSDGGTPITGYHVERRSNTSKHWVFLNKEPVTDASLVVKDLFEEMVYEFRVTAINKMGSGKPSPPSLPYIAKNPWSKPGRTGEPSIKDVQKNSVELAWTAPVDDGGAPITNYVVEYCEEGMFKWHPANEGDTLIIPRYNIKGLKENTAYKFRVAAENKGGVGPFSECALAVKVQEPIVGDAPKLLSGVTDVTVISPEVATLECGVKLGTQDAEIRWFKEAKEIYQSKKYDMFFWDNKASLVIKDTEPSDTGRYRCEVANRLGRIESTGNLSVYKLPVLDYDSRLKSPQSIRAGSSLIIDVNFTAVPNATVEWFFNDLPLAPSARVAKTADASHTNLTIKPMTLEDAGVYKVKVTNKAGSKTAAFTVGVKDKPSAPRNLQVTEVNKDSIGLSWDRSLNDGGAPITSYVIEKRDASRNNWIGILHTAPETTRALVSKLWEGCDYFFRVAAENSVGLSDYVELDKSVTAKAPFSEPESPRNPKLSDVTRNSLKVSWSAPLQDGGSPIIGYIIESRTPYNPRWSKINRTPVKGTDYTLSDLLEGDEMEFRIVAVNEAGYSKPSSSTPMTKVKDPFDKPSPPGKLDIVSVTKDRASLRWTKSAADGGAPITNYRVEMRPLGAYRWDLANASEKVTDTSYSITGLLPDTDYEFRVLAENKAGVSVPSAVTRSAKYVEPVQFTVPLKAVKICKLGEPATFECEVTKPDIRAQWLKDGFDLHPSPKYDIGVTGRNYRLTVRDVDDRDAGDYAIVVKGHRSEARLDVEARPEFKVMDKYLQPLILKAGTSAAVEVPFSGSPQPKVTWWFNGQILRENRRVHVETIHNLTSLVISRAERSDAGTYSLTLDNQFGTSNLSVKVIVLDKPGPPRDLRATAVTEDSVTLTWLAPSDNGGSDVTSYIVEKREALRMTWQPVGITPDTTITVPNLSEGVQYVFRVSAVNKVGTGAPEELSRAIAAKSPHYVPTPPSAVHASDIYHDSCVLSWSSPSSDGGSPITGYHIEQRLLVRPSWLRVTTTPVSGTRYHVTGLMDGQSYQYRVFAENRIGLSEPSAPSATILAKDPWEKPGAPGLPQISDVTRRSCKLSWLPPTSDGGDDIRTYVIEYKTADAFKWIRANEGERILDTSYRVTGLHSDLDYEFRVAAENRAGTGPYSEMSMPIRALDQRVHGKEPSILSHVNNLSTNAGQTIKLECDVSLGKPKAEVRWFKDGREIYKTPRFRMTTDDNIALLTISNVEQADAGNYTCEAYNQHGRVESTGTLVVNVPPVLDVDHRYKFPQEVKCGSTLILPINYSGIPRPRTTWYRQGIPLGLRPGRVHIDSGDNYSTLTILGIESDEGGRYEAAIENVAGSARYGFDVVVKSVPSMPSNLRLTSIQRHAVSLSWEAPDYDGGMPVTGYVIERSDATRGGWVTAGSTDSYTFNFKIPKLLEGNKYYFRVMAENAVGTGKPLETLQAVEVKSPYDTPEAPRNVEIAETSRSAIVIQWQPPHSDGGAPVRGYVVERSQGFSGRFLRLTRSPIIDTYFTDINVHDGYEYEYRVAAENEAGEGTFSKVIGPVSAKDTFDKPWPPGKPVVTAMTRNSVNLSWSPPRNDGGSPITNYIIECKSSSYYSWTACNIGVKVSEPHFLVSNLIEGTPYEFRVVAENKSGRSDPSPSSTPIVIRELIGGKGPLVQEHLSDAFARLGGTAEFECHISGEPVPDIAWSKDYQKLIDGRKYLMKYRDAVASLAVHDVVDKDRGLYTCEASNAYGYASSTAALRIKEPPRIDVDSRFSKLFAHVGGIAKISVGFEGEPLPTIAWYKDGCQIRGKPNVNIETTDYSSMINIRRITRDDEGEYEIVVKNECGTSKARFTLKVMDIPGAPTNLRASDVYPESVTLDWTKPRSDGSSPITSYIIERREALSNYWTQAGTVDGHRTNFTIPTLRPGSEYYFRVFAENEMGVSEPCTISTGIKLPGGAAIGGEPLLPPVGYVRHVDLQHDQVTLEWEPVIVEPKYRMKSYIIERFDFPPPRWERLVTLPSTLHRYTVPDLSEDRRYKFRIFGETYEGPITSPYEYDLPLLTTRIGELPYRPIGPIIVTKVSARSLEIEWRPPLHDGGSPVKGYIIEMSESGGSWKKVGYTSSRDTKFTIAGLAEGHNYFFRVIAENAHGLSQPLQSDSVVPSEPIHPPRAPSVARYGRVRRDSVTLEWETPGYEEGLLTGYLIEKKDLRKDYWAPVQKVPSKVTSYEIPGLLSGREYMFRVRPISQLGFGEPVQPELPITVGSQYKPPSPPRGPISIFKATVDSAELRWLPPEDTGGLPLTNYIIEIRETSRAYWRRAATISAITPTYTITNLQEGVEYVIRIIAKNQEGESLPLISDFIALPKASQPPSAPNMLKVVRVTSDSVTLQWYPPYSDGGSEITKYVILKKQPSVDMWEEVGRVSSSTTSFTVSRLKEGRAHYFAVYAINKVGKGDMIETARQVTPRKAVSKPIAPVGPLTINAFSHDSVSLSWMHPEGDGSISSYRIEKREAMRTNWEVVGNVDASESSYIVRGLKSGTDYYFRVIAENGMGASQPLTLDRSFIPRMLYDKPAIPRGPLDVADVTKNSVTLSWLPPLSDGGAAVSAYVIERKETTSPTWFRVARVKPHTTSYTVTNLMESTEYMFRVFAENIEGIGIPLILEQAVIPRRPTGKPSPPSGRLRVRKVTTDSVALEWNAPYDDGGIRVTSYMIQYKELDAMHWQQAATVDSYTRNANIRGLQENHDYLFRIFAVNELGESEPLEVDMAMKPVKYAEVPSSPRGPLVISDVQKNSMKVAWQPPYVDIDSPVTGYIIEKQDVTLGLGSWTRVDKVKAYIYEFSVTHLLEGHQYLFRVIAEYVHGRSQPLESRNAVEAKSPYTIPGAPTSVRLIGISEDSITIEWSPPSTDGGRPITRYVIERREPQSQFWLPVSSVSSRTTVYQIQNLVPSLSYYFRVAAENEEGVGYYREFIEPVRPMKPKSLPAAPGNLRVEYVTRDSVTLKWDVPKDTGGVPLSGYIVEQQDGKSSRWHVAAYTDSTRNSWTLTNLIQGYEYSFRVRAENPDGAGPACTLTTSVIPKPVILKPSAPILLEIVGVTEDSVTLSWLSPERDGGSRIFSYIIECREAGKPDAWVRVKKVDSSEILVACIEGLKEGTAYLFRVYAENEMGSGPPVTLREQVIPRGELGPPARPDGPIRVIRVTRNMLAIHWSPPFDNGGYPIERYIIEKREADRSHWTQAGVCPPDVTAYCITDLAENQMYYFRVLAETAYGFSDPLEMENPVIPRRIFESAPVMEIDSWMQESQLDSTEASRVLRRITETTDRTYAAYSDEPLTITQDTLGTSDWLRRF